WVGGWLAVAQAPPAAGAVGLAAAAPDVLHVGVRGTRWVLTRGQVRDWLTHRASRPQMMLVHQRGDSFYVGGRRRFGPGRLDAPERAVEFNLPVAVPLLDDGATRWAGAAVYGADGVVRFQPRRLPQWLKDWSGFTST